MKTYCTTVLPQDEPMTR